MKMKYSEELTAQICEKLANGCTQEDAAELCGIHKATFYEWIKQYPDFSDSVTHAIALYREKLIKVVNAGSIRSPGIALEVLARRFPAQWGEVRKLQINDSQEQLDSIMRIITGKAKDEDLEHDANESNESSIQELSASTQ